MPEFKTPRGTQDLFGESMRKWALVEEKIRDFTFRYGLQEMRTPEFEYTEVFARENDSSDVVNKEMYTFQDKAGRWLTLKPEGTASLIRSYVSNKLFAQPEAYHKYFYITPCFRYEKPQQGRMRIHHQFGVEFLGEKSPIVDVACLMAGLDFIESLGLTQYEVRINTLGDELSRQQYREALKEYFKPVVSELCSDCHRRYEQNPLRILDCKVDHDHPALQNAPKMSDYLTQESKDYFEEVLSLLEENHIPYAIDSSLVRGLDYYTHTIFEVVSTHPQAGSQATIFGGGRYDNLVSQLGGPSQSSVGFGLGIERLILRLEDEGVLHLEPAGIDVYGISLSHQTERVMLSILRQIRKAQMSGEMNMGERSLKAQFKSSDRWNARFVLILGDDEQAAGEIQVKDTQTKTQYCVKQTDLIETLHRLKGAQDE